MPSPNTPTPTAYPTLTNPKIYGQLHILADGDLNIDKIDAQINDFYTTKKNRIFDSGNVYRPPQNPRDFILNYSIPREGIGPVIPGAYNIFFVVILKDGTNRISSSDPIHVASGENKRIDQLIDLRRNTIATPIPSCVCCLSTPAHQAQKFGSPQNSPPREGLTCCPEEQCQESPTLTPTPSLVPDCLSVGGNNYCFPAGVAEMRCKLIPGAKLSSELTCDSGYACCVGPTVSSPTPTSSPRPTRLPSPTKTPSPTLTPTPTPIGFKECGSCNSCGFDSKYCILTDDSGACAQANQTPPCCVYWSGCVSGYSQCRDYRCLADNSDSISTCKRYNFNTLRCEYFSDCDNGSPKPPVLRIPNGASLPLSSSVRLWWWAYREGDPYGNWAENKSNSCIPETASDRKPLMREDCWGWVCAKGSAGVLPEWRYYEVYVKEVKEGVTNFDKICHIDNIPNPAKIGDGVGLEKTSCLLNLNPNDRTTRTYEWKVRAGYRVNTGYETYTDSETRTFTIVSYNLQANCSSDGKSVTLSWNSIPGVTGYNVIINNQSVKTGLTTTSYTVPLSSINQADIYHWWIDPYYGESWNTAPSASGPDFTCGAATQSPTPTLTPIPQGTCEYCRIYDENWNQITDLPTIKLNQRVYLTTKGSLPNNLKARFRINGTANNTWCNGTGLSLVNNWCETTLTHNDMYFLPYTFTAPGRFTIEAMVFNVTTGWY